MKEIIPQSLKEIKSLFKTILIINDNKIFLNITLDNT